MSKVIEQLTLSDLKLAFKRYAEVARPGSTPQDVHRDWQMFWRHLSRKCTVVTRVYDEDPEED